MTLLNNFVWQAIFAGVGIAIVIGIRSVFMGLFSSMQFDTPSGPSIVISIVLIFFSSLVLPAPKAYSLRQDDSRQWNY